MCVDTLGEKSKIEEIGMYSCHGMGGNQVRTLCDSAILYVDPCWLNFPLNSIVLYPLFIPKT